MRKLIRYSADYNPILEYWQEIESGREVVSKKIYKTYKHVVKQLDSAGPYFYSPARANHVIEFFENYLRHSKGKLGGLLVKLELWQKAMLATIFGFIDLDGNRQYRQAIVFVGKKNGKSTLASGVGLYMQVADGEAGPEVYAVATKKDQAKIIWQEARRMVRKSPPLLKRIRTLVAELVSDFNDGVFKPLASDSDTLDGLNVHCALMDELHQWRNGRALFDIVADGVAAREQPLLFITSTAGVIREDIYDDVYDDADRLIAGYEDGAWRFQYEEGVGITNTGNTFTRTYSDGVWSEESQNTVALALNPGVNGQVYQRIYTNANIFNGDELWLAENTVTPLDEEQRQINMKSQLAGFIGAWCAPVRQFPHREPVAFLYGHVAGEGETPTHTINGVDYVGVVAPEIPDTDLPYAYISQVTESGAVYLYYTDASMHYNSTLNQYLSGAFADAVNYLEYMVVDNAFVLQQAATADNLVVARSSKPLVWANTDIYKTDGTTLYRSADSEPVPFYE